MVSILSFDSRTIKELLDEEKNSVYFQEQFPLFYKNKIQKSNNPKKFYFRTAIDNAFLNNQIIAVEHMIKYIVKYQNNFVSSFLFSRNFTTLMERGVAVSDLLNSNLFHFSIDYNEWPNAHAISDPYLAAYNGSIFDLRG